MAAIVGIDGAILIAESSDSRFNSGSGGNPQADELPVWDPSAKTWGWSDPDTLGTASPWTEIPERNEFSIDISVDIAERRPFVTLISEAWVKKARTWMSWSGSISGFYDDADNTLFTKMKAGNELWMIFFDSRYVSGVSATPSTYWLGKVLLTNVSHTTGSEDFSTFDSDFEGTDPLYRSAVPS